VKIINVNEAIDNTGLKVLVYGQAGSGKTTLAATISGKPLIISAEAGLLSLAGRDIDVVQAADMGTLREVYEHLADNKDDGKYDWIVLDSVSEVAEVVLANEKTVAKDPRQAYGALADTMAMLLRAFRDLPRNVYMSAKLERTKDDATGAMLFAPTMPGTKLGQLLPYLFDEVFVLRVEKDAEGNPQRWLQTVGDHQYVAKDRSGKLDPFELPNLSDIATKIRS
jgi:phage nucleotide-binding protein